MNGKTLTTKDVGITLRIDLGSDSSRFDDLKILLLSPGGAEKNAVCNLDPDDPCVMLFVVAADTFDEVGAWIAQPLLTDGAETLHGAEFEYRINPPIIISV